VDLSRETWYVCHLLNVALGRNLPRETWYVCHTLNVALGRNLPRAKRVFRYWTDIPCLNQVSPFGRAEELICREKHGMSVTH